MATPLSATWRLSLPYYVQGKTHKMRFYAKDVTPSGGSYVIKDRVGSNRDWEDCADSMVYNLANILSVGDTIGDVLLEQLVAGLWQPRANYTATLGVPVGTYIPSSQWTLVLRDTAFKKVKVVVLDTGVLPPEHAVSLSGCDGASVFYATEFCPTHVGVIAPYTWVVSRGNNYLNTAPFVGLTLSLNRKIRRARGLA